MRRQILDAAGTLCLLLGLTITSNIEENVPRKETGQINAEEKESAALDEKMLRAGICLAFSENSFTTESGEETGIEKRDVVIVTSSLEADREENFEIIEENSDEYEMREESVEAFADIAGEAVEETAQILETEVYENRWGISLSDEEIDLLARIVWLEARGEPGEGQEAVVEVVFNRMASDLYPDTLYDVLSQKHPVQFSSWKNRDKAKPTEKEYESIYHVLNGNTDLLRNDTMNFSTFMQTSNLDVQICCHYFCY